MSASGYLWYLQVKLPPTVKLLQDKGKLMDFLLRRRDCKMVILSVCSQSESEGGQRRVASRLVGVKAGWLFHETLRLQQPLLF